MAINTEALDFLISQTPHKLKEAVAHAFRAITHAQASTLKNSSNFLLKAARATADETEKEHLIHAIEKCAIHLDEVNQTFADNLVKSFQGFTGKSSEHSHLELIDDNSSHPNLAAENNIESRIVIQKIIADAQRQNEKNLNKITHALQNLLPTVGVTEASNPLNPSVLGMALFSSIQKANIHGFAQRQLLMLFQQQVFDKLGPFYDSIIKKMQQAGIEVSTPSNVNLSNVAESRLSEHSSFKLDTIASEEVDFEDRDAKDPNALYSSHIDVDAIELIQDKVIPASFLQSNYISMEKKAALDSENNSKSPSREALDELISSMQKSYEPKNDGDVISFITTELQSLRTEESSFAIDQTDENMINLINLIFKQLANQQSKRIGDLLLRLKPVYSRLALCDELFFHDSLHPARKLLDKLLQLINLTASDERAYRYIQTVTTNIQQKFNGQTDFFDEITRNVDHYIEHEEHNKEKNQAELSQLFEDEENHRQAEHAAENYLHNHFSELSNNLTFYKALEHLWIKILSNIALNEGTDSLEWNNAILLLSDLLTMLQAEDSDQLKGLLKHLPASIKKLNQLFNEHTINPEITQLFFDQLQEIQLELVRGKNIQSIEETSLTFSDKIEQVIEELQAEEANSSDDLNIGHEHLSFPNAASYRLTAKADFKTESMAKKLASSLTVGQWITIIIESTESAAQLGFLSNSQENLVFFDRYHHKLFERSKDDLSKDFYQGFASPMHITSSFDAAMATISKKLEDTA